MTTGFNETYYTRARRQGVVFIQYDPDDKPQVDTGNNSVTVKTRDPILNAPLEIETDLLVLATGISPSPSRDLMEAFGAQTDGDGFFREAESKWRPVDSIKEGVFACGLALAPSPIDDTVASGQAAAQRALRILTRTRLPAGAVTASVRHSLCSLCLRCVDTCPYDARWVDDEEARIAVNPGMCQGCGACAAVCPNGAAILNGYDKQQMMEMIDAAFI